MPDDTRREQAITALFWIVMAVAYPDDFTLPSMNECRQALDEFARVFMERDHS